MDAGSTCLAVRMGAGMRLQGAGAAAAAAARRLEERVGAAEGIANVRRWLLIIGAPGVDRARAGLCCALRPRDDLLSAGRWLTAGCQPDTCHV